MCFRSLLRAASVSDSPRHGRLRRVRISMMKVGSKAISTLRSTLAVALMLWCAGAGCMVVSYAHGAAMSGVDNAGAQSFKRTMGDTSASAGSHACCKAHHSSAKIGAAASHSSSRLESFTGFLQVALPEEPAPSGATSCCPLTSGTFVPASRAESNDENASTTDQSDSFSLTLTNSPTALRAFPLRLPDQTQTYLRGCVFLI